MIWGGRERETEREPTFSCFCFFYFLLFFFLIFDQLSNLLEVCHKYGTTESTLRIDTWRHQLQFNEANYSHLNTESDPHARALHWPVDTAPRGGQIGSSRWKRRGLELTAEPSDAKAYSRLFPRVDEVPD